MWWRSELAPELAIERERTAAADEEVKRREQDQDCELAAAVGPEEAALFRGEPHSVDHKDDNRQRGRTGEQPEHQQDAADEFGHADQRSPEHAGVVADAVEQCGVAAQSHAAEPPEQLLAAVWDQDRA